VLSSWILGWDVNLEDFYLCRNVEMVLCFVVLGLVES
jgi:hypothetical protein